MQCRKLPGALVGITESMVYRLAQCGGELDLRGELSKLFEPFKEDALFTVEGEADLNIFIHRVHGINATYFLSSFYFIYAGSVYFVPEGKKLIYESVCDHFK